MSLYKIFRPAIFKIEPETAHNLAIDWLRFLPNAASLFCLNKNYENLHTKLWSLDFTNPIGMAAGFDKNAEVALTLEKFGFGFVAQQPLQWQSGQRQKPISSQALEPELIVHKACMVRLGQALLSKLNRQNRSKCRLCQSKSNAR